MYAFVAVCAIAALMFLAAIACLIARLVVERRRRRDFSFLGQLCGLPVVAHEDIPRDKAIVIDPSKMQHDASAPFLLGRGPTLYVHPDTLAVIRNVTDAL